MFPSYVTEYIESITNSSDGTTGASGLGSQAGQAVLDRISNETAEELAEDLNISTEELSNLSDSEITSLVEEKNRKAKKKTRVITFSLLSVIVLIVLAIVLIRKLK